MLVRKVRGQDKIGKVILTPSEVAVLRKLGMDPKDYVKKALPMIAKKRRWKWYLNKEQK